MPEAPRASEESLASAGDRKAATLATRGQREINRLWERTQATIAIIVTAVTMGTAATIVIRNDDSHGAFLLMSNAFFVVISTYLARTNHTKTGGVGAQSDDRRGE